MSTEIAVIAVERSAQNDEAYLLHGFRTTDPLRKLVTVRVVLGLADTYVRKIKRLREGDPLPRITVEDNAWLFAFPRRGEAA